MYITDVILDDSMVSINFHRGLCRQWDPTTVLSVGESIGQAEKSGEIDFSR